MTILYIHASTPVFASCRASVWVCNVYKQMRSAMNEQAYESEGRVGAARWRARSARALTT